MTINKTYLVYVISLTLAFNLFIVFCNSNDDNEQPAISSTTTTTTTTTTISVSTDISTASLVTYFEINDTSNGTEGIPLAVTSDGTIPEDVGTIPDGSDGVLELSGTMMNCLTDADKTTWLGDVDAFKFNTGNHSQLLMFLDWEGTSQSDLDIRIYKFNDPFDWDIVAYYFGEKKLDAPPEYIASPEHEHEIFFQQVLTENTDYVITVLGWKCVDNTPYSLYLVGR